MRGGQFSTIIAGHFCVVKTISNVKKIFDYNDVNIWTNEGTNIFRNYHDFIQLNLCFLSTMFLSW